jgi:hypothetical protein
MKKCFWILIAKTGPWKNLTFAGSWSACLNLALHHFFLWNTNLIIIYLISASKFKKINLYDVYFAKDIINAKAYGRNGRLGDSQITFLSNLREWFERNKQNVEITSNPIWKTVNNLIAILDPPNKKQIILAIKNTSLKNDTKDDISAFVNSRLIKPSELYVYHEEPTNNDFDEVIPLLSYKL